MVNQLTRLTASDIFKTTRSASDLKKILNSLNTNKCRIDPTTVTPAIGIIENRMKYAGKMKVLEAFIGGMVNLLYTDEKIPSYVSTFPYVDKTNLGKLKVGVVANRAVGADKTDVVNIATFYAMMQSGYIRRQVMLNFDKYTSNSKLQLSTMLAYARLAGRVMDKLFSINVDKIDSDVVSYILAKFYLIKVTGKAEGKLTNSLASKAAFNSTTAAYLDEREAAIRADHDDMYTNIFKLFEALSTAYKVNVRSFISEYARMYGEASLLALDFYPAFLEMVASVAVNGYIYNDQALKGTLNALVDEIHTDIFFIK